MMRGLPLALLVCALATVPLYDKPLGVVAVLALVFILFTPAIGRKQAAADRSSEAVSPEGERGV